MNTKYRPLKFKYPFLENANLFKHIVALDEHFTKQHSVKKHRHGAIIDNIVCIASNKRLFRVHGNESLIKNAMDYHRDWAYYEYDKIAELLEESYINREEDIKDYFINQFGLEQTDKEINKKYKSRKCKTTKEN